MVYQNLFLSDIFTVFIVLYSFFVLRPSAFGILRLSFLRPGLSSGATPTSLPLHTIHYTLWNSVHIECKLPINCSHHPMFRCADRTNAIHAVQYIRTTKTLSYKI